VLISLLLLISNALDGFAHAAESLVGRFLGAAQPQQMRKAIQLTGINSLIAAFILVGLFVLAGDHLFRLLTDNEDVLPRLQEMHLWLWLLPLSGVASYWLDGVMVGAQATASMRNSMLAAAALVFFPIALLPGQLAAWSVNGEVSANTLLWLAFHLFLLARAAFLIPAIRRVVQTTQK
jgi:MATE family multidrug resistance protein